MKNIFANVVNKKRKGNTLSELLISIVLVGVVFTIAIGTMVADHHKDQTTVRMKKAYSVLSQAFDSAIVREGAPVHWSIEDGLGEHASYSFFDYLNKHPGQYNFNFECEIPEGVKSISSDVFSGIRKLKSVSIPSTVTSIGKECFRNQKLLKELELR